ncbi:MAG: type II secretion system protein [Armatimonadetes bacterium]|nr:type II secretion system protein [Armatimonadota bacterium]
MRARTGWAKGSGSGRAGFTLIELLVVVAILSLLAAMLLPVLASARHSARQATCTSNLRQLGQAIQLYHEDYDCLFPYGLDPTDRLNPNQWRNAYNPWTGESYHEQVLRLIAAHPTNTNIDQVLLPYLSGEPRVWHCPGDIGWRYTPNCTSVFESFGTSYIYRTELALSHVSVPSLPRPAEINVFVDAAAWHRRNANLLFADGHVRTVRADGYYTATHVRIY